MFVTPKPDGNNKIKMCVFFSVTIACATIAFVAFDIHLKNSCYNFSITSGEQGDPCLWLSMSQSVSGMDMSILL